MYIFLADVFVSRYYRRDAQAVRMLFVPKPLIVHWHALIENIEFHMITFASRKKSHKQNQFFHFILGNQLLFST